MQTELPMPAMRLDSTPSIRRYFEKVRELAASGRPYPVNMDDVWPLVYSNKGNAVKALRKLFIEGIDFETFIQNDKREIGATIKECYNLSVACMEFFVARKIKAVFEVYRKVFHHVAQNGVSEHPTGLIQFINEQTAHIIKLERKVDALKRENVKRLNQIRYNRRLQLERVATNQQRREVFELIGQAFSRPDNYKAYDTIWGLLWDQFSNQYALDIRRLPRYQGEHLIDVAIRHGRLGALHEIASHYLTSKRL